MSNLFQLPNFYLKIFKNIQKPLKFVSNVVFQAKNLLICAKNTLLAKKVLDDFFFFLILRIEMLMI